MSEVRASARPGRSGTVLRIAGVLAATAALLWWTMFFTASMVLATARPEAAYRAWPTGPAESTMAATLIARPVPRAVADTAAGLSVAALRRSPVDAMAARALAQTLLQRDRYGDGRRMIGYAETLSRRDLPTQLWLIEDRVQAGDVVGALTHYNRALTTSRDLRPVLIPVLADAASGPAVLRALVPMLRPGPGHPRPEWWSNLLGQIVNTGTSASALSTVAAALRLDAGDPTDRLRLQSVLLKLVQLGDVHGARLLYARGTGMTGVVDATVVDPGFERDRSLPPVDWSLAEEGGYNATIAARDGADGRAALTLTGSEGQEVAREALQLRPGSYLLQAKVGAVPAGLTMTPALSISCGYASGPVLATMPFPISTSPTILRMRWIVPASACPVQSIVISAASGSVPGADDPWIDSIDVRRIGG